MRGDDLRLFFLDWLAGRGLSPVENLLERFLVWVVSSPAAWTNLQMKRAPTVIFFRLTSNLHSTPLGLPSSYHRTGIEVIVSAALGSGLLTTYCGKSCDI